MNLKTWMLGFLGVQQAAAVYTTVSPQEAQSTVNLINSARRSVNPAAAAMPQVIWDFKLQAALDNFTLHVNPAWWFDKNQTVARYNGEVLMQFEPFKTQFPGHGFMTHDGCMNNPKAITKNFAERIRQKDCFDYYKCPTTVIPHIGYINNYFDCNRYPYPAKLVSGTPCSWFWQYYPMIVNDNVKTMACLLTGHPGPNADGKDHVNHLFCYYGNVKKQITEQPYVAGPSCSACLPTTKCKEKLCLS